MDKFECVCGYVYGPASGQPDNGGDSGIAFIDLPSEWVCPICGATQDNFEKI